MSISRRNFIGSLMVAGASFSILPGSGRVWVARRERPILVVATLRGEISPYYKLLLAQMRRTKRWDVRVVSLRGIAE